jgi:hypothetical protein
MSPTGSQQEPFVVRDCALVALATGSRAQNLRELRDRLLTIDTGSIYYHFWGGRLRPRFDDPEYNNDFAAWARHSLHDGVLAERLAVVDPTQVDNLEELRQDLLDVVEECLDERPMVPWARPDQQFNFLTSQIVVFDTHKRLLEPEDLVEAMPAMSRGSVFYHFIDARRRNPDGLDDLRTWLLGREEDYGDLCQELAASDPFFSTLLELREELSFVFREYFGGNGL